MNVYGYGPFSPQVSFVASDVPSTMAILSVTLSGSTDVQVSWTTPNDNYQAIDQYDIEFLTSDGVTFV